MIQHIYDTHFEGYAEAKEIAANWEKLEGKIPSDMYNNVHHRFEMQLANAREWCDQVNSYFYRKSGIEDELHREIY